MGSDDWRQHGKQFARRVVALFIRSVAYRTDYFGRYRRNASKRFQVPAAYELNVTGGGAFSIGTGINDVRGGTFNTYNVGDDFSITHGNTCSGSAVNTTNTSSTDLTITGAGAW